MPTTDLSAIAEAIVAPGKGILAADESDGTIKKRFDTIGVESTEESRRDYRELLFTTAGAESNIGGVILFDETIRQSASDGRSLVQVLLDAGIAPGIKVDKGAHPMEDSPNEKLTAGLDGLPGRLAEYASLGAVFAKWRAVITIGDGIPTDACIKANAEALAHYAKDVQDAGMVPIVEPEVLMDGDHTIERCEEVTGRTLDAVYDALAFKGVVLEGTLLKPNMVLSGKDCPQQASVQEVAEATIRCLLAHVPPEVPGIVFLSGGQSDVEATEHLNAMNALGVDLPWEVSFSYGRALQAPVLAAWQGDAARVEQAQAAYLHRARCNGAARDGSWSVAME